MFSQSGRSARRQRQPTFHCNHPRSQSAAAILTPPASLPHRPRAAMSASSHPQSLSTYHQTLSDHISTLLSRLPPAHDGAEASGTNPPARQARDQEFQLAWEAQGAAIHRALPSSFILQMDAGSNAPRRTSANATLEPESATARNDRHLKRIERSKRRIERWRARVNVDSVSLPPPPPAVC